MIPIPQFTPKRGLSSFVRSLFANSEQGAWYDPSDMATLFQTASGSDAVTAVEQPVSLMLDKSKGLALGSEVVTNGTFAVDSNWTKGTGWSIGSGVATKTAGSAAALSQSVTVTAGTWYKITFTVTRTAGSVTPQFTGTTTVAGAAISAAGTYTQYLLAATGNNSFEFSGDASFAGTVDDVSVKSIAGNHAYTPSTATASRPVLSARVNLLTKTEQFDNADWTKQNTTATSSNSILETATTSAHNVYQGPFTVVANQNYTFSVEIEKNGRQYGVVWVNSASNSNKATVTIDFDSGTITQTRGDGSFTYVSSTIKQITSTRYQVTLTARTSGSQMYVIIGPATTATPFTSTSESLYAGDITKGIYIWSADFRVANDGVGIPAYQRVNTSTDYDTVGFPMYLKFDGSDDYMLTNSVDFSGGDAICVGAAVRKLSDAALGVVLEHSATLASNDGTFLLSAPNSAAANFNFSSKGSTAVANTATTYTSPISAVIVADADISADINNIRINNGTATAVTSDQGSGNYGNFAMYLGRRGGTASPFNGRLYGAIVRAGAITDGQVGGITSFLNSKSKVY